MISQNIRIGTKKVLSADHMTRAVVGLAGPFQQHQLLRLSPYRRVTIKKSLNFRLNSSLTATWRTLGALVAGCMRLMSTQLSMASCEGVSTLTLITHVRALALRLMNITSRTMDSKNMT